MPSKDKRPILHATDVKFDKCAGVNIICIEPHVDLRRNYEAVFSKTTNITAFMSVSSNFSTIIIFSFKPLMDVIITMDKKYVPTL